MALLTGKIFQQNYKTFRKKKQFQNKLFKLFWYSGIKIVCSSVIIFVDSLFLQDAVGIFTVICQAPAPT